MITAAVLIVAVVAGLMAVVAPSSRSQAPTEADRLSALAAESDGDVRTERHATTGAVRFVGTEAGKPIDVAAPGEDGDASASADAFVDEFGALFGPGADSTLEPVEVEDRLGGGAAALFRQEADDVPVLAAEVRVQLDESARVLSASGETSAGPIPSTEPAVTSADAASAARTAVAKQEQLDPASLTAGEPELWIYDAALLGGPAPHPEPVLVWRLEVQGTATQAVREMVLVDAGTGSIVLQITKIAEALQRTVCDHRDVADADPCPPQTRSEGGPPTASADVDDAYDYSGDVYDFFQDRFGRDSLDDAGFPLHSRVRYCTSGTGCPYANAFWDGSQMTYGSGFASADDVVAHELAHGFTEFTSDLLYYYQSGAINESLSDVFGEYIDLTNGAGDDDAGVRWDLGEDLPVGAIRDMADPASYGDPDRMTSPDYTGTTGDHGGVHTNSGVNNKAAVLLVDGGSFNGRTVTGIGVDKAARIYYEVATTFLTSGSDYADLGDALVQACTNLIGQASIAAGDCVEVGDAVAATEMGTVPPAAPASEAPVCETCSPTTSRAASGPGPS
jgi:Zn-dependent metalloprotease